MMDAVGLVIASQNRNVTGILTLLLIPQKQHSDKPYLNQIITHLRRMVLCELVGSSCEM